MSIYYVSTGTVARARESGHACRCRPAAAALRARARLRGRPRSRARACEGGRKWPPRSLRVSTLLYSNASTSATHTSLCASPHAEAATSGCSERHDGAVAGRVVAHSFRGRLRARLLGDPGAEHSHRRRNLRGNGAERAAWQRDWHGGTSLR
eukprot:COSAG03_NODE_1616_length_3759_cov_37.311069_6_plen_152_part_00